MSTENWLPVPGYDGLYEVSDQGQVRSLPRNTTSGRILRPIPDKRGYQYVTLTKAGFQRRWQIHQLVLAAFVEPCPPGMECRHVDGDPRNNVPANLVWGTHADNMRDKRAHRTDKNAAKTHCPQGHEYSPDNTVINKQGSRVCRTCARERGRLNQAARRARLRSVSE